MHRDNKQRESASGRRGARLEPHGAALGELDGVVDQVLESRAQPHRVADEQVGQVVGNVRFRREAFRLRARRQRIRQKFDEPPRPENFFAQRQRAGFRLGRIKDQVVSEARCSALALMPAAQLRSFLPRVELASNSPSARMPVSAVRMSCANAASAASWARAAPARRDERRRAAFATDFAFDLERAMAPPRRRGQHATAVAGTKQAQGIFSQCPSPTIRLISAAVVPRPRNSRRLVACVDFDSLRPSASRMRRW